MRKQVYNDQHKPFPMTLQQKEIGKHKVHTLLSSHCRWLGEIVHRSRKMGAGGGANGPRNFYARGPGPPKINVCTRAQASF